MTFHLTKVTKKKKTEKKTAHEIGLSWFFFFFFLILLFDTSKTGLS